MATHSVSVVVTFRMGEMDGTPEQSAEIAAAITKEALAEHWDASAEVLIADGSVDVRPLWPANPLPL